MGSRRLAVLALFIVVLLNSPAPSDQALVPILRLIISVLGRSPNVLRFAGFAQRFAKSYTITLIKKVYKIFLDNFKLIQSINNIKGLPYELGINLFADLTWEEFRATRLGTPPKCSPALKGNHKLANSMLPETKDWREDGIVSPVEDQGACGSSWSFSATGSLEAAYAQATRKNISLSEQQLIDCASAFNNFGCGGGLPSQAFEYIKHNRGIETKQSYPYHAANGSCSFNPDNVGVKVVDTVDITMGDEIELKDAVAVRPVSIVFEVVRELMFYTEGVYTGDTCGRSSNKLNHAALVVGYGVERGMPYWLIKNSWGKDWGLDGYFKMERGKNMCGVATCASYPVVAG